MNESHLSLLDGGQQRSGTVNTKPPQTCPLHTSANQERVKNRLRSGTDVWKLREKRWHLTDCQWTRNTIRPAGLLVIKKLEEKTTYKKTHEHTKWNPRELAGSDHNPLLPTPPHPSTQGRTSQRPKWVSHLWPRTATCTPSEFTFLLVSFYFFSSCALSPSLSVAFLSFFFWVGK